MYYSLKIHCVVFYLLSLFKLNQSLHFLLALVNILFKIKKYVFVSLAGTCRYTLEIFSGNETKLLLRKATW